MATFTSQRSSASQEPQDAFVEVRPRIHRPGKLVTWTSHSHFSVHIFCFCNNKPAVTLQDIIARLLALARAEEKGVRLRICQLLQLIINNQVARLNKWSPLCKDWGPLHSPILFYSYRAS